LLARTSLDKPKNALIYAINQISDTVFLYFGPEIGGNHIFLSGEADFSLLALEFKTTVFLAQYHQFLEFQTDTSKTISICARKNLHQSDQRPR
jgi:hypothetical protein